MNSDIKKLLLLPHLKVQNANALSSPFTIGFPAITAWLGAVHALQRKVNGGGLPQARFNSVAIISHQVDLQALRAMEGRRPRRVVPDRPRFTESARRDV